MAPGMLKAPDGSWVPIWDDSWGIRPEDYPVPKSQRLRALTPQPRAVEALRGARPGPKAQVRAAPSQGLLGPAGGAVAEAVRGRGRRRTRCTWCKRWAWRFVTCLALFCFLGPHGSQITSHLASIGGATAEVVKAAGDVASAGANMTVAVSHFAIGAISISVSAAEDFWHCVDLHAAVANRTVTKAAGSSPQSIRHWVAEGAGGALYGDFLRAIFQFAEGFNGSVPVQAGTGQLFRAEGHYFAWHAEMRLLPSGYIGFAVSVVSVSFQPRWANPSGSWPSSALLRRPIAS